MTDYESEDTTSNRIYIEPPFPKLKTQITPEIETVLKHIFKITLNKSPVVDVNYVIYAASDVLQQLCLFDLNALSQIEFEQINASNWTLVRQNENITHHLEEIRYNGDTCGEYLEYKLTNTCDGTFVNIFMHSVLKCNSCHLFSSNAYRKFGKKNRKLSIIW